MVDFNFYQSFFAKLEAFDDGSFDDGFGCGTFNGKSPEEFYPYIIKLKKQYLEFEGNLESNLFELDCKKAYELLNILKEHILRVEKSFEGLYKSFCYSNRREMTRSPEGFVRQYFFLPESLDNPNPIEIEEVMGCQLGFIILSLKFIEMKIEKIKTSEAILILPDITEQIIKSPKAAKKAFLS